jgi:hypothetical protein
MVTKTLENENNPQRITEVIIESVRNMKGDTVAHLEDAISWHGGLNWLFLTIPYGAKIGMIYKNDKDAQALYKRVCDALIQYQNTGKRL